MILSPHFPLASYAKTVMPLTANRLTIIAKTRNTDKHFFKFDLPKDDVVPLIIDIAPMDFERMVLNIIENARTHGFTDSQRNDYRIDINLTINTERDMYQIDFSNNGNPLPKGMNKIRYGLLGEKAGITGGSGRGGYVVKSIVEHYYGDYDVFMNGETTVIRILLPISKQYGE